MDSINDILKAKIKLWILYSKMTSLGEIARRYFVMNFFDGVLTVGLHGAGHGEVVEVEALLASLGGHTRVAIQRPVFAQPCDE